MSFFKKLFGKKSEKNQAPESNPENFQIELPATRLQSLAICAKAGFQPAKSLPTSWDTKLRPSIEIAGRLHAIKAMIFWLLVPSEHVSDDKILQFIDQNRLEKFMTDDELIIFRASRDDQGLKDSIGWKFENAWPLAWYFGYEEPKIYGNMMAGEQMQEILMNYTCSLDENLNEWASQQETLTEEAVIQKEDLFYCLHNAVRSAQLGRDTVPDGFDPVGNGGVIHERRHSLTWMLSAGTTWDDTDLST
ncbi:DUF4272 domain-containing protein [uncultured Kordia sp.]|uniref:DUF4272 domain-containing protein n=1 Tax=uncultured Kordia sp. TaxID=507699 RepID=UPI00262BE780|nr:DUF4272 domain-containing protein [uncultured Kordia sp.]